MSKGILKFKSSKSKGAMHYIEHIGKQVSLTQKQSRKVQHLEENETLEIAKNLMSRNFNKVKIQVKYDPIYVKEVYDFMLRQKHTHYKNGYENLVVLEYAL